MPCRIVIPMRLITSCTAAEKRRALVSVRPCPQTLSTFESSADGDRSRCIAVSLLRTALLEPTSHPQTLSQQTALGSRLSSADSQSHSLTVSQFHSPTVPPSHSLTARNAVCDRRRAQAAESRQTSRLDCTRPPVHQCDTSAPRRRRRRVHAGVPHSAICSPVILQLLQATHIEDAPPTPLHASLTLFQSSRTLHRFWTLSASTMSTTGHQLHQSASSTASHSSVIRPTIVQKHSVSSSHEPITSSHPLPRPSQHKSNSQDRRTPTLRSSVSSTLEEEELPPSPHAPPPSHPSPTPSPPRSTSPPPAVKAIPLSLPIPPPHDSHEHRTLMQRMQTGLRSARRMEEEVELECTDCCKALFCCDGATNAASHPSVRPAPDHDTMK